MTGRKSEGSFVTFRIAYRTPFDWDGLLAFMAPRAIPGVETVSDGVYRRTVDEIDFQGIIKITKPPRGDENLLLARVTVVSEACRANLSNRVRRLFDLDADPSAYVSHLSKDALLRPTIRKRPGLRVPGAWNRFETAVRAVLGQQISVAGATQLAGRLVQRFGRSLADGDSTESLEYLFPRPEDLLEADIGSIGMPRARAETIRGLARAVCEGKPVLEPVPSLEVIVERLTQLPGIGDWTAQYIAMRAFGEPDAFPAGDLGVRKALARKGVLPTPTEVRIRAESWRPWRAYATMWLWISLSAR
jgi:AraC family transcriptional regulator of adaptative response / DNA-3-methyladenine glycosylase II